MKSLPIRIMTPPMPRGCRRPPGPRLDPVGDHRCDEINMLQMKYWCQERLRNDGRMRFEMRISRTCGKPHGMASYRTARFSFSPRSWTGYVWRSGSVGVVTIGRAW